LHTAIHYFRLWPGPSRATAGPRGKTSFRVLGGVVWLVSVRKFRNFVPNLNGVIMLRTPTNKNWAQSIQGFLPPHIGEIYTPPVLQLA